MKITDEQIDRANTVNLPQFLMANGFDLKKVGREYVWKEHDSLRIKDNSPGERGKWFRFSTDEGGDNINFVQQYMGKSFVEAVELLNGESYVRDYVPSHSYDHKPKDSEKVDIVINENDDCKRVFGYLCGTRGLDYDMISELVKSGKIAQEQKTGNVVFKIFDENNKLVGVEKVGTSTEHKFKSIATGSASGYGFEVCKGNGENALFFESSIDMLSYLQMYGSQLENHRLVAMMGVKPSIVLDTMERYGILSENVFLCSDNDKAGNEFAERLIESFPQMKRVFPDSRYKDWNDMLRKILIQKTKEVEKVTTYGNKTWNDATDNRDKSLISMNEDTFMKLKFNLDASGITIGETEYTDRKEAAKAFEDAVLSIKTADVPVKIGEFQGFPLSVTMNSPAMGGGVSATIKGAYPHTTKLIESFAHNLKRLEGALYNVDRKINDVNTELSKLRVDYAEAQKIVAEPFPQAVELTEKSSRLKELTEELNQAAIEAKKNAKPKEKTCYFERAKLKKEAMRISQKKSDKGKKKEKNQGIED